MPFFLRAISTARSQYLMALVALPDFVYAMQRFVLSEKSVSVPLLCRIRAMASS
jgi:hypothetical protein